MCPDREFVAPDGTQVSEYGAQMPDHDDQLRTAVANIQAAQRALEASELPATASRSAHAVRGMTITRLAECRRNVEAILADLEGDGSC